MVAFRYYINRLLTLPLTQKGKNTEWATILHLAKHNGFPIKKINRLKTQLITRLHKQHTPPEKKPKNGPHLLTIVQQQEKSQIYLRIQQ